MPIDRRRRDCIAELLLQHLRGETPPRECGDQIGLILDESPSLQHDRPEEEHHDFPVLTPGTESPTAVDDHLLDVFYTPQFTAHLLSHRAGSKLQEKAWQALCRSFALLRSGLTEQDLGYPRQCRPRRFPLLILWPIAIITLIATIACALRFHPAFLLLWPAIGTLFLFRLNWFIQPPSREHPDAFPFLTVEQWNSAANLIAPGEIPPFVHDRYPAPKDEKTPQTKALWKRIVFAPLLVFPLLLLVIVAAFMFSILLLLILVWPFSINHQARRKAATQTSPR